MYEAHTFGSVRGAASAAWIGLGARRGWPSSTFENAKSVRETSSGRSPARRTLLSCHQLRSAIRLWSLAMRSATRVPGRSRSKA